MKGFCWILILFLGLSFPILGCSGIKRSNAENDKDYVLTIKDLQKAFDKTLKKKNKSKEDIAMMEMLNDHIKHYDKPTRRKLEEEYPVYIAANGKEVLRDSNNNIISPQGTNGSSTSNAKNNESKTTNHEKELNDIFEAGKKFIVAYTTDNTEERFSQLAVSTTNNPEIYRWLHFQSAMFITALSAQITQDEHIFGHSPDLKFDVRNVRQVDADHGVFDFVTVYGRGENIVSNIETVK